jgi:hypothetical protein
VRSASLTQRWGAGLSGIFPGAVTTTVGDDPAQTWNGLSLSSVQLPFDTCSSEIGHIISLVTNPGRPLKGGVKTLFKFPTHIPGTIYAYACLVAFSYNGDRVSQMIMRCGQSRGTVCFADVKLNPLGSSQITPRGIYF